MGSEQVLFRGKWRHVYSTAGEEYVRVNGKRVSLKDAAIEGSSYSW